VTSSNQQRVGEIMHQGDQASWTMTALAVALNPTAPEAHRHAAGEVISSLGVDLADVPTEWNPVAMAGQAGAPILQAAAVLRGDAQSWAGQSDAALIAQGRASGQAAAGLIKFGFPMMPGLAESLAQPNARMLDVGTGVAALAVAWAELLPAVTVVGIDVLPRVLALAARTVAASRVADRVVLREQDVAELTDENQYRLAWLPAPFVPEAALREGMPRIFRALAPGGWVIVGHGKYAGNPTEDAVSRFKTVAFGGTALDDAAACQLLIDTGFDNVSTMPTPPGAPAIAVGRRPG
jgi:SAM-dependent methyltransferase